MLLLGVVDAGQQSGEPRLQNLVLAADIFEVRDWGLLAAALPVHLTVRTAKGVVQHGQASELALHYTPDGMQTTVDGFLSTDDRDIRIRSSLSSWRPGGGSNIATVEP